MRNKIWKPYTAILSHDAELVSHTKGNKYFLKNGDELIDAISSWWVVTHGHSKIEIIEAIKEQLVKLSQVIFTHYDHESAEELVDLLSLLLPPNFDKYFFSDNGSTAVEVALKIAIQYNVLLNTQKKPCFIALDGAYHGDTFGSMSVSELSIFTNNFKPYLFEVKYIPHPNADNINLILNLIESKYYQMTGFIYEPLVQGAGGMRMLDSFYFDIVLKALKNKNVLLIADEVMTGFGRTGTHFASEQLETQPDLLCLSKGITGGFLPLGLTIIKDKITEIFRCHNEQIFYHGHSYTGNALSCAASVASLKLQLQPSTLENIERISQKHQEFINQNLNWVTEFNLRSKGTILAFDLNVANKGYENNIKNKVIQFFRKNNIIIRPLGNVVYIIPPYCTTTEELNFIYHLIKDGINKEWQY